MNKTRIAILITVFLSFVIIGFSAAMHYGHHFFVQPVAAAIESATPTSQKNILIIRVDDLQDPDLISVWIVFSADYDTSYISFKSLYPDPITGYRPLPVSTLFSLGEDGALSAPFVHWLEENHVEWDGYFLMDQQGLGDFGEWMTGEEPLLNAIIPKNREQSRIVFQEEAQMYQKLCASLNSPTLLRRPAIQWSDLMPDHMRTDFDFETAVLNWDQITSMVNPHCEVIGLE